jgi:hypothetical protein
MVSGGVFDIWGIGVVLVGLIVSMYQPLKLQESSAIDTSTATLLVPAQQQTTWNHMPSGLFAI